MALPERRAEQTVDRTSFFVWPIFASASLPRQQKGSTTPGHWTHAEANRILHPVSLQPSNAGRKLGEVNAMRERACLHVVLFNKQYNHIKSCLACDDTRIAPHVARRTSRHVSAFYQSSCRVVASPTHKSEDTDDMDDGHIIFLVIPRRQQGSREPSVGEPDTQEGRGGGAAGHRLTADEHMNMMSIVDNEFQSNEHPALPAPAHRDVPHFRSLHLHSSDDTRDACCSLCALKQQGQTASTAAATASGVSDSCACTHRAHRFLCFLQSKAVVAGAASAGSPQHRQRCHVSVRAAGRPRRQCPAAAAGAPAAEGACTSAVVAAPAPGAAAARPTARPR